MASIDNFSVQRGDLVRLTSYGGIPVCGYVHNFNAEGVSLSTEYPLELISIHIEKPERTSFGRGPNRAFLGNKPTKYTLSYFKDFEVVEKARKIN